MLQEYFYVFVSQIEWTNLLLVFVFCAHASSGVNWVYSTTMLQTRSDDEWRGRVAGTDYLVITFTMGCSALAAALLLEYQLLELRSYSNYRCNTNCPGHIMGIIGISK